MFVLKGVFFMKNITIRKIIHRLPILIIPTIILILYFCISFRSPVSAEYGGLKEICRVESVLVKKGDTITAIAQRYAPEYSYISAKQYMEDILELNNMSSEYIQAGNYILLPIYVNEA